ncbi:hypothetical protein ACFQ0F_08365 [Paraperlucidibaca wandonensis]|uniref:DUF2523 domain-containing protein n=1 Tax=Paraperlucidibaca wandonensis TaxID=1268273 RepID=A0ABW3HGL8_9GAMM
MYAILFSAFNSALAWVFRAVLVKFVVAYTLFHFIRLVVEVVASLGPSASALESAFAAIPPGVWWFLDAFQIGFGLTVCLSAYSAAFIIRRLS